MSTRLNQDREKKLEPVRIEKAISELKKIGYCVTLGDRSIQFTFKGSLVIYYPYSGWATGKSIKDGRGLKNLLNQIKEPVK